MRVIVDADERYPVYSVRGEANKYSWEKFPEQFEYEISEDDLHGYLQALDAFEGWQQKLSKMKPVHKDYSAGKQPSLVF